MLFVLLMALAALSIPSESMSMVHNVNAGLVAVVVTFLLFSIVALPNSAFVRPHPAFWRVVLGASLIYLLVLVFVLFQSAETIKRGLNFFGHNTEAIDPLDDPNYASEEGCQLTWDNVSSRFDLFVFAHFAGWFVKAPPTLLPRAARERYTHSHACPSHLRRFVKAIMLRSSRICWFVSALWELSEYLLSSLLPNFAECAWDQLARPAIHCRTPMTFFRSKNKGKRI